MCPVREVLLCGGVGFLVDFEHFLCADVPGEIVCYEFAAVVSHGFS